MAMINPDGYYTGHVRRVDKDEIIRRKAEEAGQKRRTEEAEEFLRMHRYGINNRKGEQSKDDSEVSNASMMALGLVMVTIILGFLVTLALVKAFM